MTGVAQIKEQNNNLPSPSAFLIPDGVNKNIQCHELHHALSHKSQSETKGAGNIIYGCI